MGYTSTRKLESADLILQSCAINFQDVKTGRLPKHQLDECIFTAKRRIKRLQLDVPTRKIYLDKLEDFYAAASKL